jgi:RNA polymerase sigma factor (sigma-70 family)
MSREDRHSLKPLLERSRAGEPEAQNALLGKLRPFLKALIRSWLGPDLAQQLLDSDVVQETLLRIHQGLPKFRGQGVPELRGWVRTIAYHAALARKQGLGRERPGREGLPDVPAPELSPLDGIEQAEDAVRLTGALEQLPPGRREVVLARLWDGLPYSAISQRTGSSEGALRIQFQRAITQLRQIMETEQ